MFALIIYLINSDIHQICPAYIKYHAFLWYDFGGADYWAYDFLFVVQMSLDIELGRRCAVQCSNFVGCHM